MKKILKNRRGILGTIAFHAIIVLIFVFFGFHTPLPLPDEEGILINFGTEDEGSGIIEPAVAEPLKEEEIIETTEEIIEAPVNEEVTDPVITQDFEESAVIEQENPDKIETENKVEEEVEEEEKEIIPVEEIREVNENALYTGRNTTDNTNKSEGEETGEGNQGKVTGDVNATDHDEGTGLGSEGISYSLEGRNPQKLPKPEYNYQVEGKVVVEVTVDRNGNVIQADPGRPGSTTLNSYLLQAAKKAALAAKFDRKPDAPIRQKGTITYIFHLK